MKVTPAVFEREQALLRAVAEGTDPETGANTAEEVRALVNSQVEGFFASHGQIEPE